MRKSRIEVYRDGASEWRWRFIAPNGRIMADSGEGYRTKFGASEAATKVLRYMRFKYHIPMITVVS